MNVDEYVGERGYVVLLYINSVPWVKTSRNGTPFGLTYATKLVKKYKDQGYNAELKKHSITLLDV